MTGPVARRRPPATRPGTMSALVAVTVLVGAELIRAFPALVAWELGSTARLSVGAVVVVGVAPFVLTVAVAAVVATRDPTVVLAVAGLVLAAARLGVQVADPGAATVLAGVGVLAFLTAVTVLALMALPLLGGGVAVGVVLDAAVRGALGTRDLVWIDEPWSLAAVGAICGWLALLVIDRVRRPVVLHGRDLRSALPLLALGPALLAQTSVLANPGWVAEHLGTTWAGAAVVIGAAGAAGVIAASATARRPDGWASWWGVVGGGAVVLLATGGATTSWGWAPVLVVAQAGMASALTTVGARGSGSGGPLVPALVAAAGHLVMLVALSASDGRGVLGVPLSPTATLAGIGVLVVGATALSLRRPAPAPHRAGRAQVPSVLVVFALPVLALLVALPVLSGVAGGPDAPTGFPVRVATYNVRLAFSADGRLNVEEVAEALGAARPDVVGLQEVPRGHLASGGVDMLGWLQRSLDLPYAEFQAATPGALHGNAILSRYPLHDVERRSFRRSGTDLPRGVLAATVDLGDDQRLRFLTAHLPPGGTLPERRGRVATVLEVWGGEPGTVVAADTNAPPGSTTMRDLVAAGLRPVWSDAADPGFTYPSDAPRAKIDWLLASPDLAVSDAAVLLTAASDHLPLVATVTTGPPERAGG